MAEFILKPNEFQGQVDTYRTKTETVAALKYTLNKESILLQSIDKYQECVDAMNELVSEFSAFADLDADTMQKIKAKWMNTDTEIATKTLVEILGG